MAKSRMFNKQLVSKDKFLQLSCATQLLYFHLCLNADDDGFVDNVISLIQLLPVNIEDLKTLIEKGYVLIIDDYLYVITHWRIHNNLDKNHYVVTAYVDYLKKLFINENKEYSLNEGTNLYEYQIKRGFLKNESENQKKITDDSQNNMNSKRVQNELKTCSECAQKEPQLSQVKISKDKESQVKLSQEEQTIRNFLKIHNLSTIDERFDNKLVKFFQKKNKNNSDVFEYLMFVFQHMKDTSNTVNDKLFYSLCFKEDIFEKFHSQTENVDNKHWPELCPICGKYHDIKGDSDECILIMGRKHSEEELENARKWYNNKNNGDNIEKYDISPLFNFIGFKGEQ